MTALAAAAKPEVDSGSEDAEPVLFSRITLNVRYAVRLEYTERAVHAAFLPVVRDPNAPPHTCAVCEAMDRAEAKWLGR